jgi:universal stress protein A
MKEFKKILVPTDYSALSLTALDYAQSFANMHGSVIYLLHTLDTIPVLAFHAVDLTTETVIFETEKNAKSDLHAFTLSKIGNLPNLIEVVRKGIAEEEIVKFANDEDIDLIVMATHGRSGLSHALMGSVAERVVQHSRAPVLTVKPENMQSETATMKKPRKHPEFSRR